MKTIFHDKESGTKLEMEGTFRNSKAQLVDDEGNIVIESEGSYLEILKMFNQLSGEENEQLCEDAAEDEEKLTKDDFRDSRVKVLEDITDECGDTLDKGTITTDVNVLYGDNLLINRVIVKPEDFKKLEILTDEQKNIQPDELFVVNNDEMEYYLEFKKGDIVKFLYHLEDEVPLLFRNSEGIEQALEHEDVTLLKNQEGNKLRFNFCYENDILLTEDTSLKGTKVNLTEQYGAQQEDVVNHITNIMLTSKQEHATVSSSDNFIKSETKRIVNVIYKYNYKLIKKNRHVEIYKQEVLDILSIKEKPLKQLYLIHLVQSKRHAKANGTYFITYDTMIDMGSTKNRKSLFKYMRQLEERGFLEIVERKVWDVDRLKTEGKSVYKPNLYKVKKIVTSEDDVDSITIKDNQGLDLDKFLKSLTEHFTDIELKNFLPRKQYERVMKASYCMD